MRGVPTGLQDLDTFIEGLQGADLVIIATPSAASKMSLALSMALHVATTNQRGIGLFSLTMNKHHFIQRLLPMRTGIDLHLIRTGWITEEERTLLTTTARTLSKAHLWIDDRADLSLKELRQRARQLVETHRVTLMMVDNLHLIQPGVHGKRHENRLQELSEVRRGLKELAQELNIPVVVCAPIIHALGSQRSKDSQRSNLRDSSLEKAADHVLFLYRDDRSDMSAESTNVIIGRIVITKHRNGLVTEVDISILPRQARFRGLKQVSTQHPEGPLEAPEVKEAALILSMARASTAEKTIYIPACGPLPELFAIADAQAIDTIGAAKADHAIEFNRVQAAGARGNLAMPDQVTVCGTQGIEIVTGAACPSFSHTEVVIVHINATTARVNGSSRMVAERLFPEQRVVAGPVSGDGLSPKYIDSILVGSDIVDNGPGIVGFRWSQAVQEVARTSVQDVYFGVKVGDIDFAMIGAAR